MEYPTKFEPTHKLKLHYPDGSHSHAPVMLVGDLAFTAAAIRFPGGGDVYGRCGGNDEWWLLNLEHSAGPIEGIKASAG